MDLGYLDDCFDAPDELRAIPELRLLCINLTTSEFKTESLSQKWLKEYVGGPALAMRIWAENSEEDPVVLLSGHLCQSGITDTDTLCLAFRSPQNNRIMTHTVKTDFSVRLLACGFEGLVIMGKTRRYSQLAVVEDGAQLILTEQFTHMTVSKIQSFFNSETTSAIITGPASERKLSIACAVLEGRSTGRGGLGALLEEKNIRVISVEAPLLTPEKNPTVLDDAESKSLYAKEIRKNGTCCYIDKAFSKGWAPVNDYRDRTDPRLIHLRRSELIRKLGDDFDKSVDYESILMLGPNCNCYDIFEIYERYRICIDFGLDPVSAGNKLGSLRIGNKYAKDWLEGVSIGETPDVYSQLTINGLECGGCDYRGAFASGLFAALGNTGTLSFDLLNSACSHDCAQWVSFSEDLIGGLESYGFDTKVLLPAFFDSIRFFKRLVAIIKPSFLPHTMNGDIFSKTLSKYENCQIEGRHILELGRKAWRIKTEINKELGSESPMLPDYFCVYPKSNFWKESIVPLISMVQRYLSLREHTVVRQNAQLDKRTESVV